MPDVPSSDQPVTESAMAERQAAFDAAFERAALMFRQDHGPVAQAVAGDHDARARVADRLATALLKCGLTVDFAKPLARTTP